MNVNEHARARTATDLSREECHRLLAGHRFGRLGFVHDGRPMILPVNYAVDEDIIVFRTDDGLKLHDTPMRDVVFEIDGFDETGGTGWSVLAHGFAFEITHAIDHRSAALQTLEPDPLAPGPKAHLVQIWINSVSGRRLS